MTWSRGVRPARDAVEARLTRAAFVGRASGVGLALVLGGGAARLIAGAGGGASAAGAAPAVHRFRSRPDLSPPVVTAVRHAGGPLAPGLIFMTPGIITGQMGTLIADNQGERVWFGPTT